MRKILVATIAGVSFLTTVQSMAETKEKKSAAPSGHCEKNNPDGSHEDIEAKDKADCKALGGKWSKKNKGHDSHDHKEGEGEHQ